MGKISFAHGLIFLDHWPRWLQPAVQQFWRLVLAARGPVSKCKAAATPLDAADAADTSGGGGEGAQAGVDLGFVLQASADNEEVAPATIGEGGPGA